MPPLSLMLFLFLVWEFSVFFSLHLLIQHLHECLKVATIGFYPSHLAKIVEVSISNNF